MIRLKWSKRHNELKTILSFRKKNLIIIPIDKPVILRSKLGTIEEKVRREIEDLGLDRIKHEINAYAFNKSYETDCAQFYHVSDSPEIKSTFKTKVDDDKLIELSPDWGNSYILEDFDIMGNKKELNRITPIGYPFVVYSDNLLYDIECIVPKPGFDKDIKKEAAKEGFQNFNAYAIRFGQGRLGVGSIIQLYQVEIKSSEDKE